LFSTREPQYHREQKRITANAFSMTSLLEMEAEVDSCTELFTRRMSEVGDNGGKEVDLGAWLQHYAFDVIGELTFSKKFGFLERGEDVDKVEKMIDYFLIYTSRIGQIPVLHYFMFGHPLLKYMGVIQHLPASPRLPEATANVLSRKP
jgi:hypothetical protein